MNADPPTTPNTWLQVGKGHQLTVTPPLSPLSKGPVPGVTSRGGQGTLWI